MKEKYFKLVKITENEYLDNVSVYMECEQETTVTSAGIFISIDIDSANELTIDADMLDYLQESEI